MPITNPLAESGFGRPLPDWVGELQNIKLLKTELKSKEHKPAISMPQLAKKLKRKTVSVRSVLTTILDPDFYLVENGVSFAMYFIDTIHEVGQQFNSKRRYRSTLKEET